MSGRNKSRKERKMKRLVAGVLAGLLCLVGLQQAVAQGGPNLAQTAYALALGAPGVVLNSTGSNYGLIENQNSNASTTWFLGYGVQSNFLPNGLPYFNPGVGTSVLQWNTSGQVGQNIGSGEALASQNLWQVDSLSTGLGNAFQYYYIAYTNSGWLALHYAVGYLPTVASCGTSPSIASGTDEAGDVTFGSSGAGSCTVTFASPALNIPHCVCNDSTTASTPCSISSLSKTGLTLSSIAGSQFQANDRLDWLCLMHE